MNDPIHDFIAFLQKPAWPTPVFWVLLAASLLIAFYAFVAIPDQRRFGHICNWLFRLSIGGMWWQQTLWKLPPYYTDQPHAAFGKTGLANWMIILGKSASVRLQADFVNNIVLPHFYLFAPVVYGLEVLTAVSLMLGLFVRFWGLIGALQILNLWLGLYNAYGEWPWTYFSIMVLMLIFTVHRYGRSLGLDAIMAARPRSRGLFARMIIAAAT
jgi:uncharacterized membrane protein YphA (DoxX/SURF4 family)